MIKITVLDREDFVIEDDESIIKIEGIQSWALMKLLEENDLPEIDEVDDETYLVKTKDLDNIKRLDTESQQKAMKSFKKDLKKALKIIDPINDLERVLDLITPTKKDLKAAGLKIIDINENKEASYEERLNYARKVFKIEKKKYEALNPEDRAIIDKPVALSFDMTRPDYKGITDAEMTALYDEAWARVCHEEELDRYRKPDLVLHEQGLNHLPPNVLAAYSPAQHKVTIGKMLWENYGNVELIEKERQEIIDVFIHEFSHIVNFHHGDSFWELTGRNDSVGQQIKDYKQKQIDEFEKKIRARKH